jgi:hypothetical protein
MNDMPPSGGRRRLTPEEIQSRHQQDPLVRQRAQQTGQEPAASAPRAERTSVDGQQKPGPLFQQPDFTSAPPPPQRPAVTGANRETPGPTPRPGELLDHVADNMWRLKPEGHIDPQDRPAFLATVQPEGRRSDIAAVKPVVIQLVLGTNATTETALRSLMSILCRFAIWCRNNTADGTFTPARDLNEDQLEAFRVSALGHLERASQATYMSAIRRAGSAMPKARTIGRDPASAPYSSRSVDLYWNTALEMDEWIAVEMRTLLALTFGAGGMANEITWMKADQVLSSGSRITLQITRRHVLREVPVYGAHGTWLQERSAQLKPGDFLLRPTVLTRKNAVSDTVKKAAKRSTVFEGFKALRARHTWVCRCLMAGIPLNVLNAAAGVGPDNNLFSDLTAHLPNPTPADIRRAFDQARNHSKEI